MCKKCYQDYCGGFYYIEESIFNKWIKNHKEYEEYIWEIEDEIPINSLEECEQLLKNYIWIEK